MQLLLHAMVLPGAETAYFSPQHKASLVLILWISPALCTFFLSLEGKAPADAGAPAKYDGFHWRRRFRRGVNRLIHSAPLRLALAACVHTFSILGTFFSENVHIF